MTKLLNRYPGTAPFSEEYQSLFFGRNEDIDGLSTMIQVERLVVLHGKSGLGKSSLLNAGVLPKLRQKNYLSREIRMGAYSGEGQAELPLDILQRKIWQGMEVPTSFLDQIDSGEATLWQQLKAWQWQQQEKSGSISPILLVFDQFEELFTYPEGVAAFAKELAGLLNNTVPRSFTRRLRVMLDENPELFSKEQLDFMNAPLQLKAVMAIRADRMSLLGQLSSQITYILQNLYELKPLTREQAEQAIVVPAQYEAEGLQFSTPPFQYEDALLERMLDFLTKGGTKDVESFQLQILCKYVENTVPPPSPLLKEGGQSPLPLGGGLGRGATVQDRAIPDLSTVFEDYYKIQIANLDCTEQDRLRVRILMEEGLIFAEEERRLSLFEGVIHNQYRISPELLAKVEQTRLLRTEPHSDGGFMYEVSHDTLVKPILVAFEERKQAEEEERARQEAIALAEREKQERQRKRRRQQLILGAVIIALLILGGFTVSLIQKNNEATVALEKATLAEQKANEEAENAKVAEANAEEKAQEALEAKQQAEVALAEADAAKALALEKEKEAQLQLAKVLEANKGTVKLLLANARKKRDEMAYGEALGILANAEQIGVLKDSIAAAYGEYAFYYALADSLDLANELLVKGYGLLGKGKPILSEQPRNKMLGMISPLVAKLGVDAQMLRNKYLPVMVDVKGGTMGIGSSQAYEVTLSDYRMAKYEVTAAQYFLFCEATNKAFPDKPGWGWQQNEPIVNVNWYDAVEYCNYISGVLGLIPAYAIDKKTEDPNNTNDYDDIKWLVTVNEKANGLRLPTEAEWEYAARGGQGEEEQYAYSGSNAIEEVGWHSSNSGSKANPVGGLAPNKLGLYDMSGNVYEWCWDWYDDYPDEAQPSPVGPASGDYRVCRGGAWRSFADNCKVSYRYSNYPYGRYVDIGFRPSQTIKF